jgi:protein-S-isoprenylcysteine O-methyltransferase Ste14
MTARTWFEDRMLRAGLPRYQEYASDVRHRLVPGIW